MQFTGLFLAIFSNVYSLLILKRKMKIEVPMASYGSLKVRGHKDPLTLFRLMEFSIKTPYYKVSMVHCIYQRIISVKNLFLSVKIFFLSLCRTR